MRAAAHAYQRDREIVRNARNEAREPGFAPGHGVRTKPFRSRGILDGHNLAVHQPGGKHRSVLDGVDAGGNTAHRAHEKPAAVIPRIRQKERDLVDAQCLRNSIDEPLP